ncbi:MAG: GAF domain-containing protein [Anaerolineae bacterium]|nr:GAF domain-containing protein [Anaerolineae bacterium]
MGDSEFKIEWLFVSLRWFFLMAIAGIIGLDTMRSETKFPALVIILLAIGAVGNMITMIALLRNTLGNPTRTLVLVEDTLLTLGFIVASGGTQSPLLFVSLIPIMSAAMRFSFLASMIITLCVVIAYWFIAWRQLMPLPAASFGEILKHLSGYLANGLVLLLAGGTIAQLGSRINQTLNTERDRREKEAAASIEAAHQKARLIFELASTLSATLNYERVLEAALDVSNAGLREFVAGENNQEVSQTGMILLFGMDQTLYVARSRGISQKDEQLRFPAQKGILVTAVEKAEPVVTDDPASDPELSQISVIQYSRQAIVVPLRAGFESYGLLLLCSTEPDTYTPDFQDLLIAICNQAVMALQNASLYQNLMEEKERLVAVDEDARKKLARDLHDGPTQTIAAIAMRLNYIRMLIQRDPAKSLEELEQLEDLARKTTKEIRQMLFTLRPLILESQGLIAALQQLKQKINETDPLPIHLELDKEAENLLSQEAQGAVFYITEEATTNVRKHAKAENLWIRLYRRGMNVIAEIEDDGEGFDLAATEANYASRGSLGMRNLYERAELVKGKTAIKSTKGQGTKITVTIQVDTVAKLPDIIQ